MNPVGTRRAPADILVVSFQPPDILKGWGLEADSMWFRQVLSPGSKVRILQATEEPLPTHIEEKAVVIGGSIHSVYAPEAKELVKKGVAFIHSLHVAGIPTLGVCFGHQLMAHAFGGTVQKSPFGREFGYTHISLTETARYHPLFYRMGKEIFVASSHRDTVIEAPGGTQVLAVNSMGIQGVSYSEVCCSLQFHPEMTPRILTKIGIARKKILVDEGFSSDGAWLKGEMDYRAAMHSLARERRTSHGPKILRNFVRRVAGLPHRARTGR